ncbi:MAG: prepilin-type N-terminal cleavage/methylation domain-containing protein [Candidatus Doudnabacteria bacterium]|nr:prepilin-type N-terminal cleavage/methylation domain-containing protein [Candidatus Doudnabacteria bacterium]
MANKTQHSTFHIPHSQKGMSLIEVIVSMFMLAVLLTLYAGALNTVAQTKKLKYENLAYHAASKKMEELRATTFASLPPSGTISDPMLSQIPSGSGSFTVFDYGPYSGIKEIIVTVSWNDGKAKSVVLKTLAGSGGINP